MKKTKHATLFQKSQRPEMEAIVLNINEELRKEMLNAKSAEQVKKILTANGYALSEKETERIFEEVAHRKNEELSPDELEAVSGGADRDWLTEGCAATVEPGSWCWSNDLCKFFDVVYEHAPYDYPCDLCGGEMYLVNTYNYGWNYRCRKCGHELSVDIPIIN